MGTRLALFAELRPTPVWNVRLHANLTNGHVDRRREQYEGLRGAAPLKRTETRTMVFGRYFGITIQRSFGT